MKQTEMQMPSQHDLEIWEYAEEELFNYLYKGIAGWFQIQGHRILGKWSLPHRNQMVLEIGCGQGHHVIYSGHPYQYYLGLDNRFNRIEVLKKREAAALVVDADAFAMPFKNHSIDCLLSIYIFEHLKELRKCLLEVKRVLKKNGKLLIALPAEGGFLYKLGRSLTSKRYMEKKFGFDYDAIIRYEHVNNYFEVYSEVKKVFRVIKKRYSPFPFLPTCHLNAVVCLLVEIP